MTRQSDATNIATIPPGFSLFLERPPTSFSDKWNDRPLRNFVIVKPETDQDKARFLSNIWQSYSHLKAQHDKSFTLLLKQQNLSVFWNLYDRKNYLVERRKVCASMGRTSLLPVRRDMLIHLYAPGEDCAPAYLW